MVDSSPRRVDVWYTSTEGDTTPALHSDLRNSLSPDEREAYPRRRLDLQEPYLISRALTRYAVSSYLGCCPAQVSLARDSKGRPKLATSNSASPQLDFNLSHTSGIAVLAVARDAMVGVDVESAGRRVDVNLLIPQMFSAPEADWVQQSNPEEDERERRFLQIWTLKEAWSKATGAGISAAFGETYFRIHPSGQIEAILPRGGPSGVWTFQQFSVEQKYIISVAALHASIECEIRSPRTWRFDSAVESCLNEDAV